MSSRTATCLAGKRARGRSGRPCTGHTWVRVWSELWSCWCNWWWLTGRCLQLGGNAQISGTVRSLQLTQALWKSTQSKAKHQRRDSSGKATDRWHFVAIWNMFEFDWFFSRRWNQTDSVFPPYLYQRALKLSTKIQVNAPAPTRLGWDAAYRGRKTICGGKTLLHVQLLQLRSFFRQLALKKIKHLQSFW